MTALESRQRPEKNTSKNKGRHPAKHIPGTRYGTSPEVNKKTRLRKKLGIQNELRTNSMYVVYSGVADITTTLLRTCSSLIQQ